MLLLGLGQELLLGSVCLLLLLLLLRVVWYRQWLIDGVL